MSPTAESQARIHIHRRTGSGFGVQLRSDSPGVLDMPGLDLALVSVHVGHAARMSCRRAGMSHTGSAVHGDIDIVPVGMPAFWQMHDEHDRAVLMAVSTDLLHQVADENGHSARDVELRNRFMTRDRQLENIAWAMKSELEMGSPSGELYLDGLALSAAARLIAGHSSVSVEQPRYGGLDGRRLRRTLEYIEAHLADDLSLARLATAVEMSVSHFRAGFRESAGVAVHQYVIERRVERAKSLLMREGQSIAEIALASGFTHQSHMARHMQRTTGFSPLQMKKIFAERISIETNA